MPMPHFDFATPAAKRAALTARVKKLYASAVIAKEISGVLTFVEEQLPVKPERSDD